MKVLLLNSVYKRGSTGRMCCDLAKALEANGHVCRVAYGRYEQAPDGIGVYFGSRIGSGLHGAVTRLFDRQGFASACATRKLIRWIRVYDPDVIHLHNLHGYYIHVGLLFQYLKEYRGKVVWTLHDCWAFTGHCAHFTAVGCAQWKTHCRACVQKRTYPASCFLSMAYTNYARKCRAFSGLKNMTLVSPSEWLAGLIRQSFLKAYPVKVIHNGVDTRVFHPQGSALREKYALDDKNVILAVAGVWDRRKGLDDVIALSERLDAAVYAFVLIGLRPAQLAQLPEHVIGIAHTDHVSELAQWYTAADLLVNPTYEDNYPTVNLEAQACGTPVLAYDTGGNREAVPAENIVETGDVQAMASRILQGVHAIRPVKDSGAVIAEYMELYENDGTI